MSMLENFAEHEFEFDTGVGYVKVWSGTRVSSSGHREHVVGIGETDFALTDAPMLATALLTVYQQQIDAEGLTVKAVRDE
ncbi:hypothetical protein [Rhodococcus sp. Chr-9]|uniref:hypothetical protein n=1 Tax=Rhodococcus sp. Chr-9 TaxID=713612 RepID=UPI000A405720|nr:hypothetical protein [Rhodococcus sp. Chr-9]